MTAPLIEAVPADLAAGLHSWLAEVRDQPTSVCPVRTGSGAVLVLVGRAAEVRAALLHPALVVRESTTDVGHTDDDGNLIALPPAVHARRRAATAGLLSRAGLAPYNDTLHRIADTRARALDTDGPFDLLEDFCRPYVAQSITEVFGLPLGREDLQAALTSVFDRSPGRAAQREQATGIVRAAVTVAVDACLEVSAPVGTDLISRFVQRPTADTGGRDALISLVATLVLGGFGSTVQAIALMVHALAGDDATREHWQAAADPTRTGPLLAEVLRLDSPGPFASPRTAIRDVVIGDSRIPAGSTVLIALASADRDAAAFTDADRFHPDRSDRTAPHTFGIGAHRCPGAVLARAEVIAAIAALVRRFPALTTVPPGATWRGSLTSRGLDRLTVSTGPPLTATTAQPRERRGSRDCDGDPIGRQWPADLAREVTPDAQ